MCEPLNPPLVSPSNERGIKGDLKTLKIESVTLIMNHASISINISPLWGLGNGILYTSFSVNDGRVGFVCLVNVYNTRNNAF